MYLVVMIWKYVKLEERKIWVLLNSSLLLDESIGWSIDLYETNVRSNKEKKAKSMLPHSIKSQWLKIYVQFIYVYTLPNSSIKSIGTYLDADKIPRCSRYFFYLSLFKNDTFTQMR